MADVIMKPTVVGSKWTSFDAGSEVARCVFPSNNLHACIEDCRTRRSYTKYTDITILQVMATPYGDKLRYTVEYIEC